MYSPVRLMPYAHTIHCMYTVHVGHVAMLAYCLIHVDPV